METQEILEIIQKTESPLKRQLLMVALLTRLLKRMNSIRILYPRPWRERVRVRGK